MGIGEREAGFVGGLAGGLTRSIPPILERMDEDRRNKELVDLIMPEVANLSSPDIPTAKKAAGTIALAAMRAGKTSADMKGYLDLIQSLVPEQYRPTPAPQPTPPSPEELQAKTGQMYATLLEKEKVAAQGTSPEKAADLHVATLEDLAMSGPKETTQNLRDVMAITNDAVTKGYAGLKGGEAGARAMADIKAGKYRNAKGQLFVLPQDAYDYALTQEYLDNQLRRATRNASGFAWWRGKPQVTPTERGKAE